MHHLNGRRLAGILMPIVAGAVLAGCGDDGETTANRASTGAPAAQTTPRPAADAADVDRAFVRQMVPHHMMAVEMAEFAADQAEHEEIRSLSREIITAQSKEIRELEAIAEALGVTPGEPMHESGRHGSSMAGDAKALGLTMQQMGMSMDMAALERAEPFDRAFIDEMTVHHRGAIAMAEAQLAGGQNADLKAIATAIVSAQEREIAEMAAWKAEWYPGAGGSDQQPGAGGSHDMSGMGH